MKSAMAVELGKGPAVKVMDRSVICTPAVVDALEQAAKDCGVSAQREILLCGRHGYFGAAEGARKRAGRRGLHPDPLYPFSE